MTRDELEAVIWQALRRRHRSRHATGAIAIAEDNRLVRDILTAADDYATGSALLAVDTLGTPDIQAQRRAILEAALSRSRRSA